MIEIGRGSLEITAPTDIGRLTWLTEKALRHGRGLRLMGAILLGIALVAGLIVARPQVTALVHNPDITVAATSFIALSDQSIYP